MKTIPNIGQNEDRVSSFKSIMNVPLSNVTLSFLIVTVKILAYKWMHSELMIPGGKGSEFGFAQIYRGCQKKMSTHFKRCYLPFML